MKRLTITDCEIANQIMHHPEVYPYMCDDFADPSHTQLGTFFLQISNVWLVQVDEHILLLAVPRTHTICECHIMIKPEGRTAQAVKKVKEAAFWFFNESKYEKLIGHVPFCNKRAMIFALLVGMSLEGVCKKSFKKNGKLLDQWILGLEKEKVLCQQQ